MRVATPLLMRSLAAGLILVPTAPVEEPQEDLKRSYEHKLSLEFIEYGRWITDYDEARAQAREEDKVLFVYFSRSYAP